VSTVFFSHKVAIAGAEDGVVPPIFDWGLPDQASMGLSSALPVAVHVLHVFQFLYGWHSCT